MSKMSSTSAVRPSLRKRERKVVVVEDDVETRRLICHYLKSWGYAPLELGSGERLLDLLVSQDCHCVLLDIQLPDVDGLELLREIKHAHGGVKVIMLTGNVSLFTLLTSMRRGAEAVIFKPVTDFEVVKKRLAMAFDSLDEWWACMEELKQRKDLERTHEGDPSMFSPPAVGV